MELNELEAKLQLLRDLFVQEFNCPEFYVRFASAAPATFSDTEQAGASKASSPESLWHNSTLWPGGSPPKFPAKEAKKSG